MRKILIKYIFLIACLFVSFGVTAQKIPPPGLTCCDLLYEETGNIEAYKECIDPANPNPNAYCDPVIPIDISIYVYISMAAGLGFGSFVMVKKIKSKKTPI